MITISSYGRQTSLYLLEALETNIFSKQIKNVGIINWWWLTPEERTPANIESFVSQQDLCIFFSEEIVDCHSGYDFALIKEVMDKYNVYYLLFSDCGITRQLPRHRVKQFPWFVKTKLTIPETFRADIDYRKKPFDFNLLLGSEKNPRNLIYRALQNNNKIYSTYFGHPVYRDKSMSMHEEQQVIELLSNQPDNQKLNTMVHLECGHEANSISHIVPKNIYDNTHFDIVTETQYVEHQYFTTEKTAKPLATGRWFCFFNSANTIAYLNAYGFDFGSYLGTYDNQTNQIDRLNLLLELVDEVTSNQSFVKEIYSTTKDARLHNMYQYQKCVNIYKIELAEWLSHVSS